MPNWTNTEIRIKGRKENVEECIKIFNANYNYNDYKFDHTFHVYRTYVEDMYVENYGLMELAHILCECAWSVYSCMFSGEYTYYSDRKNSYNRAITLQQMSQIYNVSIEVWSEESGMVFQEHYYISNGEIIINEEFSSKNGYINASSYETYQDYVNLFNGSNRKPAISEDEYKKMKENNEYYYENPIDFQDWIFRDNMCTPKPTIDEYKEMIKIIDKNNQN